MIDNLKLTNIKKSTIYRNSALLLEGSPPEWNQEFFNLALSADIDLTEFQPLKILEIVKLIEKKIGRKDTARWAPREIDIDILAIDDLVIDVPEVLIHLDSASGASASARDVRCSASGASASARTHPLNRWLKIPHYDLLNRDFFLRTVGEIEPNWKYPILK
jgi:2-amino-4-hydroxy-6-hydroxymethyldihydropteridine diphosphokinase